VVEQLHWPFTLNTIISAAHRITADGSFTSGMPTYIQNSAEATLLNMNMTTHKILLFGCVSYGVSLRMKKTKNDGHWISRSKDGKMSLLAIIDRTKRIKYLRSEST